jgi:chitinase
VCCSKYGFCGTTSEFCGKETVRRPSCDEKKHTLKRVVGYYESWSSRRSCGQIYPEQIPDGVYTHINFAFATINPRTFEIQPADRRDISLYKRLTAMKRVDPFLKVYIAVGGWSFNDPGPTRLLFSELAQSEQNQRAFFKSLISFMSTYNFDGIDIDWEYPAADDRGGLKHDFQNFPKFIANLKDALAGTGGNSGLTIT